MQTLDDDILFEQRGPIGLITLNRPKALNALSLPMIRMLTPKLAEWEKSPEIGAIVIRGSGDRAFCAGGDVRAVYDSGLAFKAGTGDGALARDFFREEYRLNAQIHALTKPYVAMIDGIVMGGGVGLSVHGRYRIATERTMFAMPECGIGFFPDVGATYFLNRCPGHLGHYLALTGARIGGADCIHAGIATHWVSSDKLAALVESFAATGLADWRTTASAATLAAALHKVNGGQASAPAASQLAALQPEIDALFIPDSIESIIARLTAAATAEPGSTWIADALKAMNSHCPLSLKITLRQLVAGRGLDLPAALDFEYALGQAFMNGTTFYEGVRAQLVDKDRNPKWNPEKINEVTATMVDGFFAVAA